MSLRGRASAGVEDAGAADVIEDGGDAGWRELADAGSHIFGAVVDRRGTELAQAILLRGSCSSDDVNAGMAGELDQRRAHAARRAKHDDCLAAMDRGSPVEHPPRSHAVDHDGFSRDGIDTVGDRH